MRLVISIFVALLAACSSGSRPLDAPAGGDVQAARDQDLEVAGWGGFPLSDRLTSLWLTHGKPVNGRPQPLILVYYVGASGWHNRRWDINSQFGKVPAWIRLTSENLVLSIEYAGGSEAEVQRQAVTIEGGDVFLVERVDGPLIGVAIRKIGKVDVPVQADVPVGEFVLNTNAQVAAAIDAALRP